MTAVADKPDKDDPSAGYNRLLPDFTESDR